MANVEINLDNLILKECSTKKKVSNCEMLRLKGLPKATLRPVQKSDVIDEFLLNRITKTTLTAILTQSYFTS